MDKIWDRKSFEVGGHWPLWWGWKNRMTTQNWQKSNANYFFLNEPSNSLVWDPSMKLYVCIVELSLDFLFNIYIDSIFYIRNRLLLQSTGLIHNTDNDKCAEAGGDSRLHLAPCDPSSDSQKWTINEIKTWQRWFQPT